MVLGLVGLIVLKLVVRFLIVCGMLLAPQCS